MGRAPCCDKTKVKRGPWSPEEDTILISYLQSQNGSPGNWISLPSKAGLKRCGKSCRLRWLNYLRPDIKHGNFTPDEDHIISSLFSQLGSRWSFIASKLPGRTDNDVKNYWNTKLKKKLLLNKNNSPVFTSSSSMSSSQEVVSSSNLNNEENGNGGGVMMMMDFGSSSYSDLISGNGVGYEGLSYGYGNFDDDLKVEEGLLMSNINSVVDEEWK